MRYIYVEDWPAMDKYVSVGSLPPIQWYIRYGFGAKPDDQAALTEYMLVGTENGCHGFVYGGEA